MRGAAEGRPLHILSVPAGIPYFDDFSTFLMVSWNSAVPAGTPHFVYFCYKLQYIYIYIYILYYDIYIIYMYIYILYYILYKLGNYMGKR